MKMAKKITKNTTVYSVAAWWRDSDPSMQAVALTAKRAEKEIESLMKDAAKSAYDDDDSYESVDDAMDDIRWSGVHAFALGDLASARELDEAISDLEDNGVWYPSRG
jgi:hypothetical protein